MKYDPNYLFIPVLIGMLSICAGCRAPKTGLNSGNINAALSNSNHVGNAIAAGNQISSMMDADSVIGSFRDVAMQASKSGTEMSLTAVGHGASKQPNVQRESKATEKLTNSLASAIKAAKSGGTDPQALARFGADLVGGLVELSEEAANPPAADDASLIGFDLKIGPGANIAGVAVSGELARTRIETVKASRSTYSRTASSDTTESNTPAGIKAIAEAMIAVRPPNSPAAVVGGSPKPGSQPEAETPDTAVTPGDSGTGEPSDMTPAERAAAWYPSALMTDKPGNPAVETALWKPAGEKTGKLAIHLPHSALGKILKVAVDDEADTVGQIGNGWRPLCRFSKPGGSYSGGVTVVAETGVWTAKNAKPAERANLDFKLAKPASEMPAVTPVATNSTGVATAPGE